MIETNICKLELDNLEDKKIKKKSIKTTVGKNYINDKLTKNNKHKIQRTEEN